MFLYTGTDRPNLEYLHKHVIQQIALNWYEIGKKLLGEEGIEELDAIKANNRGNYVSCATKMFQRWLENNDDANWDQLLLTIEMIGLGSFARLTERKLLTEDKGISIIM